MLIARIDGATRVLGQPVDWNEERDGKCAGLPIRDQVVGGQRVMVSAWTPTPDELAAIAAGAHVLLFVWSVGHPPVSIGVGEVPT